MTSRLAKKIVELVRAKSGKTSSIEIAIALRMDSSKSQCDRVSVEISKLVLAGRLRYGAKNATWDVPGVRTRTRKSLEIVPEIEMANAREKVYSEEMKQVLDMILDGVSTQEIAEKAKLDKRLVSKMILHLTNEDGKTRRKSMRNLVSAERRKRIADGLQDPPPSAPSRRPKWEKPMLFNSIFALAQGKSIEIPRR